MFDGFVPRETFWWIPYRKSVWGGGNYTGLVLRQLLTLAEEPLL